MSLATDILSSLTPLIEGLMDKTITLQTWQESQDPNTGQDTSDWVNAPDDPAVRASVLPLRTEERQQIERPISNEALTVIIDYREDVTAAWRIVYDGDAYSIVSAPENIAEEDTFLRFVVERSTASA